jgi:tetratricopeptide (TPR) repeat protein
MFLKLKGSFEYKHKQTQSKEMSSSSTTTDQLMREATGLLNPPARLYNALDMFEKAGAQYKMTKDWLGAARAYLSCAEVSTKLDLNPTEYYEEAARAYKLLEDVEEANKMWLIAARIHQETNRFSSAARVYKDAAVYNEQLGNVERAATMWDQAADCYFLVDSLRTAHVCRARAEGLREGQTN